MNVTCSDRDSIFEDGTPAQWAALEAHAATCAACAEEVRAWKALSVAAAELRDYSPSPALWSRIETALAEKLPTVGGRKSSWLRTNSAWFGFSLSWQLAAVSAFAVLLLVFRRIDLPASQSDGSAKLPVRGAQRRIRC